MEPFNSVTGIAAPMMAANIDTDVIMPKQFLKGIDRSGLDKGAFYDQRWLASGEPNPDFILNRPEWRGATFLIVGPNFGCGSSGLGATPARYSGAYRHQLRRYF